VKWEGPELSYFGYEGIVGRQVSRLLATLSPEDKDAIGSSIGDFLKTLHAMRLLSAPRITIEDEIVDYEDKLRLARPALAQGLSADELRVVEAFFVEQLPSAMRDLGGQLRLSHGDLGPWNIIVSTTGAIGVIDFGDIGYQDVSKDFSGFGDHMVLYGAFASYGADELLRKKAALRIKAFPVLDIPFYLGKADRAAIQSCLDLVRRVIIGGNVTADDRFRRDLS
jgi:aminoglycoside phosphotransferase (APT) family kinase protein